MQYLPIFLLFMAVLIAAWFYLQRAKARPDSTANADTHTDPPASNPQP